VPALARLVVAMMACGLGFAVGLAGCRGGVAAHPARIHDAYVWQRRWTQAVVAAVGAASPFVRAWHVLAASVDQRGRLAPVGVDLTTLRDTGKPVMLVVRINGQLSAWDQAAVIQRTLVLVRDWKRSGVAVIGLEIDHDCATAGLDRYAAFLRELRTVANGLFSTVAITVLPTWIGHPDLSRLLAGADEAVLQVHSVSSPKQGLFDAKQARAWVAAFARESPIPFRVALPTYGARLALDAVDRVIAVESEAPLGFEGGHTVEIEADPREVAMLLNGWRRQPPPGLVGIAWFRLPTAADHRAWSFATWRAVAEGRELAARIEARAVPADSAGLFDVVVDNVGEIDAPLPHTLQVLGDTSCAAADALRDYHVTLDATGALFRLSAPKTLRAHRRRLIGWVRCAQQEVHVRAYP